MVDDMKCKSSTDSLQIEYAQSFIPNGIPLIPN